MPGARSDGALIARVRAGDDAAFEALYDCYHHKLLAFCQHMLGSREEAEDVLQHTFLAAYRRLRAGDEVLDVKPWLYTIARNLCLSVLRARRPEVALDEGAANGRGLAAEVDRRADLRLLVRDVHRLPPDQRAALVLFELGDHSHEEIAAVLDVRRQKVKALVFQAREALMAWRAARETPCAQVREQLATLSGSALGRGSIRRHVEQCAGCREYEAAVRRQRAALAIVLPVAPAAGLKATVLGAALGGTGVAAAAGAGGAASAAGGLGASGLAAKLLVVAAVAGGAGATGYVAVDDLQQPRAPQAAHEQRSTSPVRAMRPSVAAASPASAAPPVTRKTAGNAATGAAPPKSANAPKIVAANAKVRRGGHHTLGAKAPSGKADAPGQLKAPGTPAQGKALRVGKVNPSDVAPARAKPHVGPKPAKTKAPKRSPAKAPQAAAPAAGTAPDQSAAAPGQSAAAPGQSGAAPPGQADKQKDKAAKKP